jgi:murein L,D-transpeptidase YcbB/YkuD
MAPRGAQSLFVGILALATITGAALAEEPQTPPVLATPVPAEAAESSAPPPVVLDETQTAIRDLLAGAGHEGSFLNKRDAAAVAEFYSARDFAPAWMPDGVMTDKARALIARIAAADTDGLDPSAYMLPSVDLGKYGKAQTQFTARADVMLSQAIAVYAREAYAGRVDPADVSSNIGYERHLPDPIEALTSIAAAADPVATLVAFNPPHPEFAALRDKLAELRGAEKAKKPLEVPPGVTLKPGAADYRVGFLRKRLGVSSAVEAPEIYDEAVVEAVKAFQAGARLKPDGIVGPKTYAAFNADPVDPIPTILVNMEKWRWMPRDLGRYYVRVNIPNFTVDIHKGGDIIHTTRIVVGKPTLQTPIFSDEIEHIIVNPAWNVPASIAMKEMLPAIRANPGALRGYQVFALIKGRYRAVDPRFVNWRTVDMRKIQIRQPPGERNALGKIKFMFPNAYSVYLHDTPSKSLFERDYRAYSHGCMRVMEPMEFADALLSEEADLNAAYLKKLFGGGEKRVNLTAKIPVHITYFTAWVGESGALEIRDDVYGHDGRIENALGSS